jgi:hypothetical protein
MPSYKTTRQHRRRYILQKDGSGAELREKENNNKNNRKRTN